jgi:arginase family enzyme
MFRTVSILDFDGTYDEQNFYRSFLCERLDLKKMESVCRFCDHASFARIREKLSRNPFRKIAFLGSGNYHYVSFALVSKIKTPFTLVLFDHHTDLMDEPSPSLISCGGWVRNVLDTLPNLIKVLIIGADGNLTTSRENRYGSRVELIPNHRLREEEERILKEIPTRSIYLSIDKDALSPHDASTDWDQGKMRIGKMLKIVEALSRSHRIVGADVCGEASLGETLSETVAAKEKNDLANRRILKALLALVRRGNRPLSFPEPKIPENR